MRATTTFRAPVCSALSVIGLCAGLGLALGWIAGPAPAHAQPSPTPPECVCSQGTNLGTASAPVIIRHCQCGILSCAIVVSSGQLQCTK